jgi:hypothetical protein
MYWRGSVAFVLRMTMGIAGAVAFQLFLEMRLHTLEALISSFPTIQLLIQNFPNDLLNLLMHAQVSTA